MHSFIYELLTQLIILLGWLRRKVSRHEAPVRDRLYADKFERLTYYEQHRWPGIKKYLPISCCDCGLRHWVTVVKDYHLALVIRPPSYEYRHRRCAETPDLASHDAKMELGVDFL